MPRPIRQKSATNIYHITMRRINQQLIFEEEYDYIMFLKILKKTKKKYPFQLYAYCIMSNHIHLLVQADLSSLELIIKSIGSSFVFWYNSKYQRSGHLFQDRFHSEPVETESYFLSVIRYIHNNPIAAGIVSNPNHYKWSSSLDYFNPAIAPNSFVNIHTALSISGSLEHLQQYLLTACNDQCLDIPSHHYHIDDESAKKMILELSSCDHLNNFSSLPRITRNEYLKVLHSKGISIRQLSRLCGIAKATVERALRQK